MHSGQLKNLLIVILTITAAPVMSKNQASTALFTALQANETSDPSDQKQPQINHNSPKKSANKTTIGGRIQTDAGFYRAAKPNYKNGTEIRRARLYIQGKLSTAWQYKLQYDFTAKGREGIRDAYLAHQLSATTDLQIGNLKKPFSLAALTSSKHILFTERALPHALAPNRHIGIKINHHAKNTQIGLGIFRDQITTDKNENLSISGRFSFTPIHTSDKIWHLGTSASYQSNDSGTTRIRTRPESHISNIRLIDTGDLNTTHQTLFGVETAFIQKAWHAQAEYLHTRLDTTIGSAKTFRGYYLSCSWFLTKESMQYKASQGIFSAIKPNSIVGEKGIGAWQLAIRYSNLDLNDKDTNGGEQSNLTLGLNWYPTPKIRFTMNYINTLAIDGGNTNNATLQQLQFRTQVTF